MTQVSRKRGELAELARSSARIQVAEQYQFQPLHAARLGLVRSGRLGTVGEAQVSVAHGYHGIDLIRRYLAVGMRPVTIVGRRFVAPLATGPDRSGPPAGDRTEPSERILAWLDFGDRLGVYDFAMEQYFSWVRSPSVVLRGDRGEIRDSTVRALQDVHCPYVVELTRRDVGHDGNLEGFHHAGITLGDEWVYRNPFAPARLSDDEGMAREVWAVRQGAGSRRPDHRCPRRSRPISARPATYLAHPRLVDLGDEVPVGRLRGGCRSRPAGRPPNEHSPTCAD